MAEIPDPLFPPRAPVTAQLENTTRAGMVGYALFAAACVSVGMFFVTALSLLVIGSIIGTEIGPEWFAVVMTPPALIGAAFAVREERTINASAKVGTRGKLLVDKLDDLIDRTREAFGRTHRDQLAVPLVHELHATRDELITALVGLADAGRYTTDPASLEERYELLSARVSHLETGVVELETFASEYRLSLAQQKGLAAEAALRERAALVDDATHAIKEVNEINVAARRELEDHVELAGVTLAPTAERTRTPLA